MKEKYLVSKRGYIGLFMKKILYITINKTEDKEMLITRKNKSSIVKISEERKRVKA